MLRTGPQNLPEPLARVQAAYRGTARLTPASADRLARRVEHFASSVQFVLEDSDAARRLHALTGDLRTIPRLGTLLPQFLRGAMADFGNIQIVDPAKQYAPDFAGEAPTAHLDRPSCDGSAGPGRQGPARPARQARLWGRSP